MSSVPVSITSNRAARADTSADGDQPRASNSWSSWRSSARLVLRNRVTHLRSSPVSALKASLGTPCSKSSGVVPSRLLPQTMWWSRKPRGRPLSLASSQRLTLQSSTAMGLISIP